MPNGLNQPFPKRLSAQLERRFKRLDKIALALFRERLEPALESGQIEDMLLGIQSELETRVSSGTIEGWARPIGRTENVRHRTLFFSSLGSAMNVKMIGHDGDVNLVPVLDSGSRRRDIEFDLGLQVIGVPEPTGKIALVVKPNPGPGLLVDGFVSENVRLISTLRDGIIEATRDQISREVLLGDENPKELSKRLLRSWTRAGVPSQIPTRRTTKAGEIVTVSARAHADLIARDQLAKLHAGLTRERQTRAGIESFDWITTIDGRERATHGARNGQRYAWLSGAGGEFPGTPISCRCHARAALDRASVLQAPGFTVVRATP